MYWGTDRDSRYSGARRGIGASGGIGRLLGGVGGCVRCVMGHQGCRGVRAVLGG